MSITPCLDVNNVCIPKGPIQISIKKELKNYFVQQFFVYINVFKHIPTLLYWFQQWIVPPCSVQVYSTNIQRKTESGVTSELLFVEFGNNDSVYLALIDSGAQLNVISSSLVHRCSYRGLLNVQVPEISGVNGTNSRVIQWICMPISLSNGFVTNVVMAVINVSAATIIFGMPFLNNLRAKIDFVTGVMDTCSGPVVLLKVPRRLGCKVIMALLPELTKIETFALNAEQRTVVLQLLSRYIKVWENNRRGKCKDMEHRIRLTTKRLIISKPRSYCEAHREAIDHDIKKMLQDGVIRPSMSPYSSEVVMVKKKNGEYRMCIDYRQLNNYTVRDQYPLPKVTDLLRTVKNAKYFVALDLRSGYWQIPMEEESIPFTAFRIPQGLYEFVVMPFGLTNAPSTFQRSMDFLLGDLRHVGASVYLDDILIYGDTLDNCLRLLQEVLARLEGAGLTINMEKCKFFPIEMEYLGHVISKGEMYPNKSRVAALQCIRPAKNLTELRSILGTFGYYQMFISNYSELVLPLTNALKGLKGEEILLIGTRRCNVL